MSEYHIGDCANCGDAIVVDDPDVERVHDGMTDDEPREAMGGDVFCDVECQGLAQGWLDVE